MKKLFTILTFTFLTSVSVHAQWVFPKLPVLCFGDIVLSTQNDVDNCQCETIYGSLIIGIPAGQTGGSNITNLSRLDQLTYVSNNVQIRRNPLLRGVYGFHNLKTIGNELEVYDNKYLQSIWYLYRLSSVNNLHIERNASLTSLWGLQWLTQVDYVEIRNNNRLINLVGLNNLHTITWTLKVRDNSNLNDLTGLENLTALNELWIRNNYFLQNLNGLQGLTDIEYLWIENNASLLSLDGLDNLANVQENWVHDNSQLADCCIPAGLQGLLGLRNNAYGCNSSAQIRAACSSTRQNITVKNDTKQSGEQNGLSKATLSRENQFQVFPNPTSADVTVTIPQANSGNIIVRDILGKIVYETSFDEYYQQNISLKPHGTGIFLIQATVNGQQLTRRVIVQ
ncbi:MAG: T9SS type A sorting domain-containing protein [Bacteroidota bacterium]